MFLQLVEANQRNAHLAADLADAHRLLAVAQQQATYYRAAWDGEHRLNVALQQRLTHLQGCNESLGTYARSWALSPAGWRPA